MIIEALEVENLLGVHGLLRLELAPRSPGRPVVVLRAKAGLRDPGLFNALRLALCGVTEMMCAEVVPHKPPLRPKEYVWGAPSSRWGGILNRAGRGEHAVTAWTRDDEGTIHAQRRWASEPSRARDAHEGALEVCLDGGPPLGERAAYATLERRLPPVALELHLVQGDRVARLSAFGDAALGAEVWRSMALGPLERLGAALTARAAGWARAERDAARDADGLVLEETHRRATVEQLKILEAQEGRAQDQGPGRGARGRPAEASCAERAR